MTRHNGDQQRWSMLVRVWNELMLELSASINWRTSLVPAPAVIPAPIAYIKVAIVKKLVVEFLG